MIYEVVNPSDPVTIESDSDTTASVAILLVGQGKYGLRRDGDTVMPLLFLAEEEDLSRWLTENGVAGGLGGLQKFIDENTPEIASTLDTAMVASPSDRAAIAETIRASGGDQVKAIRAWNEAKRSSMNNICGACFKIASRLRSLAEKDGP